MTGVLRVFGAEWYRFTRSRVALVAALALVGLSALRVAGVAIAERAAFAGRVQRALLEGDVPPAPPGPGNGWAPFFEGWTSGVAVGALLLLIFAARAYAADLETGVLRLARTRSASRTALLGGRVLLGVPLALGVLGLAAVGALAGATALFEFGPVLEDGYELVAHEELLVEAWRGAAATLPPLVATWTFGLLVSAASRSGAIAVSVALGVYLGFDLFKAVLGDAQRWVFVSFCPTFVDTSYMHEAASLARGFSDAGFTDEVFVRNLWLPWPEALACVAIAAALAQRRSL